MSSSEWAQPPSGAGVWRTVPSKAALSSPQQAGSMSSVSADWALHPSSADSPAFTPIHWPKEPLVESQNKVQLIPRQSTVQIKVVKYSTRRWSYICTFSYKNNWKKKINWLVRAAECLGLGSGERLGGLIAQKVNDTACVLCSSGS